MVPSMFWKRIPSLHLSKCAFKRRMNEGLILSRALSGDHRSELMILHLSLKSLIGKNLLTTSWEGTWACCCKLLRSALREHRYSSIDWQWIQTEQSKAGDVQACFHLSTSAAWNQYTGILPDGFSHRVYNTESGPSTQICPCWPSYAKVLLHCSVQTVLSCFSPSLYGVYQQYQCDFGMGSYIIRIGETIVR